MLRNKAKHGSYSQNDKSRHAIQNPTSLDDGVFVELISVSELQETRRIEKALEQPTLERFQTEFPG